MSAQFSFAAKLKVGEEIIPLASEIVVGDAGTQDGVQNGFLFKLDLAPGDPPPLINLGAVIGFIEDKLGVGSGNLAQSPGMDTIKQAFPGSVGNGFNSGNAVQIQVRAFAINSTTEKFLFSISVDVGGTDPKQGFVPLPAELASWLAIDNLAISFTAETQKAAGP